MPLPDDLLDAHAAATYCGTTWHMLRKMLAHGRFPPADYRVGAHRTAPMLWRRETLDAYLVGRNAA